MARRSNLCSIARSFSRFFCMNAKVNSERKAKSFGKPAPVYNENPGRLGHGLCSGERVNENTGNASHGDSHSDRHP